jgi:hypothetical protein
MKLFLPIFAAFLLALLPARGEAQSAASEISIYKDITVSFSANAEKCNVVDPKLLTQKLRSELEKADVKQDNGSLLVANFAVSASAFGPLDVTCVYLTTLSFVLNLKAENITGVGPRARAAVDRLGSIDMVVYTNGIFGTQSQVKSAVGGKSTAVRDRVVENIELLVRQFAVDRRQ